VNKRIPSDMSKGITDLQNILQVSKLWGERGEIWLEELLAQMIPLRNKSVRQPYFKTGDIRCSPFPPKDNSTLP